MYAKCSEEVRNDSFLESFEYVLNRWSLTKSSDWNEQCERFERSPRQSSKSIIDTEQAPCASSEGRNVTFSNIFA